MSLAFLIGACGSAAAQGQPKELKNSFAIEYTTFRFLPGDQYIGGGFAYRFVAKPWLGVQAAICKYPQLENFETPISGGPVVQYDASLLLGHRWRKAALYAEAGAGVLRSNVYEGVGPQFAPLHDVRYYPKAVLGGFLELPVGRHWSLTFDVRDNMTFIGAYTASGALGPVQEPPGTVNAPEGRAGVAVRF